MTFQIPDAFTTLVFKPSDEGLGRQKIAAPEFESLFLFNCGFLEHTSILNESDLLEEAFLYPERKLLGIFVFNQMGMNG